VRDAWQLRAAREWTYRKHKGDDLASIGTSGQSLTYLHAPDTKGEGQPGNFAWGARLEGGRQDVVVLNGTDGGGFHSRARRVTLGAGWRLGSKTNIGLGLDHNTIDAPATIPALNFGGLYNGLAQLHGDYRETRWRLETRHELTSRTMLRARAGFSRGAVKVRTEGFPDVTQIGTPLRGTELSFDARHLLRPGREIALAFNTERSDGTGSARLNNTVDLGPSDAAFSQRRLAIFWRKTAPRRAFAVGLENAQTASHLNAILNLGPLAPGDALASTATATLQTRLRFETTLLKLGYAHRRSPGLEYRFGLQGGTASMSGGASEETRALLGFFSTRSETTLKDRTRGIVVPSLGVVLGRGRGRLTLQAGQIVPLPRRRSGGGGNNSGVPPTPSPKSHTWGGTAASASLQFGF
jgi:hypothetical protein